MKVKSHRAGPATALLKARVVLLPRRAAPSHPSLSFFSEEWAAGKVGKASIHLQAPGAAHHAPWDSHAGNTCRVQTLGPGQGALGCSTGNYEQDQVEAVPWGPDHRSGLPRMWANVS